MLLNTALIVIALIVVIDTNVRSRKAQRTMNNFETAMKNISVTVSDISSDVSKIVVTVQTQNDESTQALKDAQTTIDQLVAEDKIDKDAVAELQAQLAAAVGATDLGPSVDALTSLDADLRKADEKLKGLLPAAGDMTPTEDPTNNAGTTVVTDHTGTAVTIPKDQSNLSDGDPSQSTGNGSTTNSTASTSGEVSTAASSPSNPEEGTTKIGTPINQDAITNSTNGADDSLKKADGNSPSTNDLMPVGDTSVVSSGDTNEDKSQDDAR